MRQVNPKSIRTVSTLPHEILGFIFVLAVGRRREYTVSSQEMVFSGLERYSYNFLLVCRRWFMIARETPELWSFWGNNLRDWRIRYCSAGGAPTDIVLDGHWEQDSWNRVNWVDVLDLPLRKALQDRINKDKVREIHIWERYNNLMTPILHFLTPNVKRLTGNWNR
jgi:hypothetical protein